MPTWALATDVASCRYTFRASLVPVSYLGFAYEEKEKEKTWTVKGADDEAGCGGEAMRSFLADGEWSEEANLLLYLASQRGPEARDHRLRGTERCQPTTTKHEPCTW